MVAKQQELIFRYNTKTIKHIETLIIELAKVNNFNAEEVKSLLDFVEINLKYIQNLCDGFLLLKNGNIVSSKVKEYIQEESFIDQNPNILLELAKIYFYSDSIDIQDSKIIVSKSIKLPQKQDVPVIDYDSIIPKVLKRIKHDLLTNQELNKFKELQNYQEHQDFSKLIMLSIESKVKIKKLSDDDLNITISDLQQLLEE